MNTFDNNYVLFYYCVVNILTLILIFSDICRPSITGTTDTGGVMRGTERYTVNIYTKP